MKPELNLTTNYVNSNISTGFILSFFVAEKFLKKGVVSRYLFDYKHYTIIF